MAHTALARKYRPRSFADVQTQEHVSETLRRAVAGGRTAHAYLFCGPRGVGKTTLARVLAMALNCPERTEEGEPCGTCDSCRRIWSGSTALDVVEIDAASNRGVEDARDLRERAMYSPSEEGRFKVYIVDEAHMLTREAWNALLKILEEPPPRVIFVFATTEPQRIQQTAAPILSRCQRFDFRRIGIADITDRLRDVLEQEGTGASDDALRTIARKAEGGMRDALSLVDQVLALTGGEVESESVRRILGLVEEERYLELFRILGGGRHGDVFPFVEEILDQGYDLVEFYHGLVDALRTLLRIRLDGGEGGAELPEAHAEAFREVAASFEPADLVRMLALASELEAGGALRRSSQPRMLIEMLLLRFSYLDRTVELEELVRALGGAVPDGRREGGTPDGAAGPEPDAGPDGAAGREADTVPEPEAGSEPDASREASAAPAAEVAPGPATPQPGEEDAGDAPTSAESDESLSPVEAFRRLLEQPRGLPRGTTPFLRGSTLRESESGDAVRVLLPPGPGLDRLRDPVVLRGVRHALTTLRGRPTDVVIEESGESPDAPERVSQDRVRQGRLRELIEKEPLLGRAVEELDLELLE